MLAIVSVLGVLLVLAGPEYWQDMATITDTKESTAQARILSWTAGWRMFIDNPWGVGAGSFNYLFPDYQPQEMSKNMWGRAAHSLWFTLLPELGVIGCVLYLRLIMTSYGGFLWLRKDSSRGAIVNKKEFELSTAIVASLTGFFAAASFVSVLYYPQFWILAVVIFCSKRVYQKEGAEKRIPG
jgi:O-antigen ligase